VRKSKAISALVLALALFLGSRAIIAFAFRPHFSDTSRYSYYAFVINEANRVRQSPYTLYEKLMRSAQRPGSGLPARDEDVIIEYPPLALAIMLAPLPFVPDHPPGSGARGGGAQDSATWMNGFRFQYFLAEAAVMIGLAWWLRRRGLGSPWGITIGAVGGSVLAYLLYDRLDLWLGLVLLGALGALVTGRRYWALALLAVAVNLKLVPILLLPLFLLGALPATVLIEGLAKWRVLRAGLFASLAFAGTGLAVFLPFRLWWGPRVWDFLAYHGQRGLQIESTWSSFLLVAAHFGYPVQVVHTFGADGLIGPGTGFLASASSGVVLAAVLLVYWLTWRAVRRPLPDAGVSSEQVETAVAAREPQLFVWACFAALALAMAGSKVFSPQYLCWFLPAFLLVEAPREGRAAVAPLVFLLACGLTTIIFPGLWDEMVRPIAGPTLTLALPTLRASLLALVRNLVWIGFGLLAVLHMQRRGWRASVAPASRPSRRPRRRR
jgi:hypothetical protein